MIQLLRLAPGRTVKTTQAYETYWRFAAERQDLFMRRIRGFPPPWTEDTILQRHRFTNAYRAADRVSQYLIREVQYQGDQRPSEIFFRTLLFRLFNRIETWERFRAAVGTPSWRSFDLYRYANLMGDAYSRGLKIYSAAYIMPNPAFGARRKHENHLRLLEYMMRDGAPTRTLRARSLKQVFDLLRSYPSLGEFLSFQFTIDLNYSPILNFSEGTFVVAGPGAREGIRKCFADSGGYSDADLIRAVTERADSEFRQRGIPFQTLWGRPLQLVDCQNLFCEVDKYARVAHPMLRGSARRTRIKQRFVASSAPVPQWYPPKWHLTIPSALLP